ncbi:MAG: hypothetical protein ACI9LN_001554 [Saprospiraceae bacterium]
MILELLPIGFEVEYRTFCSNHISFLRVEKDGNKSLVKLHHALLHIEKDAGIKTHDEKDG